MKKEMKKVLLILIVALVLIPVFGQTDSTKAKKHQDYYPKEIKTLFGPNAGSGGYGAITLGYSLVDGRNALLLGGRGEWVIGHGLGLGVGGYGFVNDPIYNASDNFYYSLAGGYGGFIIEPIIFGRWPIHISLPVLIGAGGVALTSYSQDIFLQIEPYDTYFEDAAAFFVAEPGVELELNLVKWMRLAFFGNYRYTTNLMSTGSINENALNGWSAGVTMKIGSF